MIKKVYSFLSCCKQSSRANNNVMKEVITTCHKCEDDINETIFQYIGLVMYLTKEFFPKNIMSYFNFNTQIFEIPHTSDYNNLVNIMNKGLKNIKNNESDDDSRLINNLLYIKKKLNIQEFKFDASYIYLFRIREKIEIKINIFQLPTTTHAQTEHNSIVVQPNNSTTPVVQPHNSNATVVQLNNSNAKVVIDRYRQYANAFEFFCKSNNKLTQSILEYTSEQYEELDLNVNKYIMNISEILDEPTKIVHCELLNYVNTIEYKPDNHSDIYVYGGKNMIYSRSGKSISQLMGRDIILLNCISTTVDPEVASVFINKKSSPIMMKIKISKDLMKLCFPIANVSFQPEELEILIPLGTKINIKNVTTCSIGNKIYMLIEAEILEFDQKINDLFKQLMNCKPPQSGGTLNNIPTIKSKSSRLNGDILICTIEELIRESEFIKFDKTCNIIDANELLKSRMMTKKIITDHNLHLISSKINQICVIPYVDYTIMNGNDKDDFDDIGYISIRDFEQKSKDNTIPSLFLMQDRLLNKRPNNVRSLKLNEQNLDKVDKVCGLFYYPDNELRSKFIRIKKYKA